MKDTKKRTLIFGICISILCVICFGAGFSVPYLLKGSKNGEQEKFDQVYSLLSQDWYFKDSVKDLDTVLMEKAISGMSNLEIDPHTTYMSLEHAQAFSASLQGSNTGLGIMFYNDTDSNIVVKQVFINSAADKAGLQNQDVIVKVDDKLCSQTKTEDLLSYIQDHKEKSMTLQIVREAQTKEIKITPTEYDSTVICNLYDDYGEIILSSFSKNSGKDVASAMQRIQKAGLSKVLLDLRNNAGGYLSAALDIASTFVPKGSVIFQEEYKDGKIKQLKTTDSFAQIPMESIVVLQNQNTASASEALIGALKDLLTDKVICVGETTYGKGTEQVSIPFADGTSLKYTIAKWLTPNGTSIHEKGFEPDIPVEAAAINTVTYTEFTEDMLIQADSVHENAKALQIFLQYLGYPSDRSDTYFSVESSKGLQQFQQDHGLDATGNCDQKTWLCLIEKTLEKLNVEFQTEDQQRNKGIEVLKSH